LATVTEEGEGCIHTAAICSFAEALAASGQ
jgi:hypothetical protein